MTSWFRNSLCMAAGLASLAAAPRTAPATRDRTNSIYDFLVMKVCVGGDGRVLAQDPLHCPAAQQRNLRPGESVPYYHADFAPDDAKRRCPDGGTNRRYAFPLAHDGRDQAGTHYPIVVGWDNYPSAGTCDFNTPNHRDTMTLLTVQQGWGAILGSRSPSGYVAAIGTGYLDSATGGVSRFNKTWGFPEVVPPRGQIGMAILPKHTQVLGRELSDIAAFPAHNPRAKLSQTIEFWTRLDFAYGPARRRGAQLDTLLEIGFPKSLPTADGPGETRGSEHLYLTREFGYVTRWEDWHRDDQEKTVERARRAFADGACSKPASIEGKASPHFQLGPVVQDDAAGYWYQDATTVIGGASLTHRWYLVGCHDFTNVHAQPPFAPASAVTVQELGAPFLALFGISDAVP